MQRFIELFKGLTNQDTLSVWAGDMGIWFFVLLFAIVFAETGFVVTPFLPGDSLLFAVGAVTASDTGAVNFWVVFVVLTVAAIIGDAVNYAIGARIGPRVFKSETSKLLNKQHLLKAQAFYEKYGGKAIVLARFVPIVRTFAPFVAGIGKMSYRKFFVYNVFGAVLWVTICLGAGYLFGQKAFVKKHFELVLVAIIVISILPIAVEALLARRRAKIAAKDA